MLVTGFGPFPGVPENPTEVLVRAIAESPPPGVTAACLDTHWNVGRELTRLAQGMDGVLMFGVAARAHRIRYERFAHPVAGAMEDASGETPTAAPLRFRHTGFDVPRLVQAARRRGFPVTASDSAGAYICNAGYGAALAVSRAALFVHVPLARPRGPLSAAGLRLHADWLIDHLRAVIDRRRPGLR
nr:hypothetical protein [Acuticoccus mangrovi]